jgi:hypothetical protein
LFLIVNNDFQRNLKESSEFQFEDERVFIVSSLKSVDYIELSIDSDRTVIQTITLIYEKFNQNFKLFFANGGYQNNDSIPEVAICNKLGIELIDGLGEKIQTSSWLIKKPD